MFKMNYVVIYIFLLIVPILRYLAVVFNMTSKDKVIILPNEAQLQRIREELGETEDRMENRLKLMEEWLQFQEHLPKDIYKPLLENFVRLCKFDIGKIKMKLELYFASREMYKQFFGDRNMGRDYFQRYNVSKIIYYLPNLTESGYRIVVIQPQDDDIKFDTLATLKYGTVFFDYLLHDDISSGIVIIYDFVNVNASFLSKVDLGAFRDFFKMYFNVLPFRVQNFHILNLPPLAIPVVMLIKSVMGAKLKERLIVHGNVEELYAYIPRELLPKDLGGTLERLERIGERWERLVVEDEELKRKMDSIRLCGPIPEHKDYLKSLDYGADGSFRQLQID